MMEHLLSSRNVRILESFCLARTLFAFDYDGTLAPIVDDPEKALMTKIMTSRLSKLNDIRPVALITGRKTDDISRLVPFTPKYLIGNHGAEGTQSESELSDMRAQCRKWISKLDDLLPIFKQLGIVLEDKEYSLSLHYRKSNDPEVAEGAIRFFVNRLKGARITKGKLVVNILPAISVNKGKALDQILRKENYQFGVYFGDDYTDEDVFSYGNSRLLTVKIGDGPTSAKYTLNTQSEMEDVLAMLLNFCR